MFLSFEDPLIAARFESLVLGEVIGLEAAWQVMAIGFRLGRSSKLSYVLLSGHEFYKLKEESQKEAADKSE